MSFFDLPSSLRIMRITLTVTELRSPKQVVGAFSHVGSPKALIFAPNDALLAKGLCWILPAFRCLIGCFTVIFTPGRFLIDDNLSSISYRAFPPVGPFWPNWRPQFAVQYKSANNKHG